MRNFKGGSLAEGGNNPEGLERTRKNIDERAYLGGGGRGEGKRDQKTTGGKIELRQEPRIQTTHRVT